MKSDLFWLVTILAVSSILAFIIWIILEKVLPRRKSKFDSWAGVLMMAGSMILNCARTPELLNFGPSKFSDLDKINITLLITFFTGVLIFAENAKPLSWLWQKVQKIFSNRSH